MTTWRHLNEELDAWATAGRSATLWWRDDDAVEPSPELARLMAIAQARDLPLALAVIPARASEALAEWLKSSEARVTLLQHGYAHQSHAPEGEKKVELGPQRPATVVLEELAEALETSEGAARVAAHRLRKRFRQRFRHAIEETLEESADLSEEMAFLAKVLA